ncbi:MAG: transposase family protein [Aureispira sp.]
MKNKSTNNSRLKVNQLSSLTEQEEGIILELFDKQVSEKQKRYTLQGKKRKRIQLKESKNSSLLGSKDKLDFLLLYLKEQMNQYTLGHFYKMSQPKVSQWLSYLLPVLEQALEELEVMPCYQESYSYPVKESGYLAADVTERVIPRKVCYQAQKADYSGKQHQHTEKNLALCDDQGYIHFLSAAYTGSTHDKTIWDSLCIKNNGICLLMDLGFLGAEKEDNTILLPFKRPPKQELGKVKKQLNEAMGKLRVIIEHAFAGVKRLKIIRQKIRIRDYQKREMIVRIAFALHNLRVKHRKLTCSYS